MSSWRAAPSNERPLASSARRLPLARPPHNGPSRAVRAGSTGRPALPRMGRPACHPPPSRSSAGPLVAAGPHSSRPASQLTRRMPGARSAAPRRRARLALAFQRGGRGAGGWRAAPKGMSNIDPRPSRGGSAEEAGAHGPGQGRREIEEVAGRREHHGVPVQGAFERGAGGCWAVAGGPLPQADVQGQAPAGWLKRRERPPGVRRPLGAPQPCAPAGLCCPRAVGHQGHDSRWPHRSPGARLRRAGPGRAGAAPGERLECAAGPGRVGERAGHHHHRLGGLLLQERVHQLGYRWPSKAPNSRTKMVTRAGGVFTCGNPWSGSSWAGDAAMRRRTGPEGWRVMAAARAAWAAVSRMGLKSGPSWASGVSWGGGSDKRGDWNWLSGNSPTHPQSCLPPSPFFIFQF